MLPQMSLFIFGPDDISVIFVLEVEAELCTNTKSTTPAAVTQTQSNLQGNNPWDQCQRLVGVVGCRFLSATAEISNILHKHRRLASDDGATAC